MTDKKKKSAIFDEDPKTTEDFNIRLMLRQLEFNTYIVGLVAQLTKGGQPDADKIEHLFDVMKDMLDTSAKFITHMSDSQESNGGS